jgi:hypothetical protein
MRGAISSAAAALACSLVATSVYAHGVVGQRSFIEPFITEDVNPKNEFVIARPELDHSRDGHSLSYGFGLEKKLADYFSITFDTEWDRLSPKDPTEPSESGFNNLGITLKDAFYVNPPHEAIVSFAVESRAPTGTQDVGAEKDWSFKPFFLYGKGFGDLPDGFDYLRPFAVQGDAGVEVSTGPGTATTIAHNIALQYSVPYLQAAVRDFGIGWPFNDLIADVEFNFEHIVHGEEKGTNKITTTPGIVYMDRWVELGVAGRFPLTGSAHDELSSGVIFIVDLFIDDIWPGSKWQPF